MRTPAATDEAGRRPAVAVLVPFRGDSAAAAAALAALDALSLRPGDEIVVADNSDDAAFAAATAGRESPRVVVASGERSSYHARNVAAAASEREWLLFVDADCRPPRDLLDRYFARDLDSGCGLLAGGVEGAPGQDSAVARWSRSRAVLAPQELSGAHPMPFGATANLMVRRRAWEAVGGFQEGIRSGGDAEFCWRVQDAGWTLAYAPEAAVGHLHRESLGALARVEGRYGAGRAWLNRHRPGATPRPRPLRALARCAVAVPALALTGRFTRARFKLIDAIAISASALGWLRDNRPPAPAPPRPRSSATRSRSSPRPSSPPRRGRSGSWGSRSGSRP